MTALATARQAEAESTGTISFLMRAVRHELGKFRPRNKPFYRVFKLPVSLERELLQLDCEFPADRHGRCPFRKMQAMAGLIVQHDLKSSVEIGVYRGSSLLPQAVAMRRTGGKAIGIDPYSMAKWRQKQAKEQGRTVSKADYDAAVSKIDWEALYREVMGRVARYEVEAHCTIIRGLSHEVAPQIKSGLDMLHIDGNHDGEAVSRDLQNYLPKLRSGGFLVMDDVTWQGVAPHYNDLKQTMPVIWETETWAVLRKT